MQVITDILDGKIIVKFEGVAERLCRFDAKALISDLQAAVNLSESLDRLDADIHHYETSLERMRRYKAARAQGGDDGAS